MNESGILVRAADGSRQRIGSAIGQTLAWHRRYRTTAGYTHLADGHLGDAAERIGTIIAATMKGPDKRRPAFTQPTP